MKIGIDISSLQSPHRLRGIGRTSMGIILNLPTNIGHSFVFYINKDGQYDISSILNELKIPKSKYEIRTFKHTYYMRQMPSKLKIISSLINLFHSYVAYTIYDGRYPKVRDLDIFVQLDQTKSLPRLRLGAKNYIIAYDLIPYVLEKDYLNKYQTCRHQAKSIKLSLLSAYTRLRYIKKIRINSRRSHRILAISKATARDFIKYANVSKNKIAVIRLGIDNTSNSRDKCEDITVNRYYDTPWGYFPKTESLINRDYIFFVGGADERRRLVDLVAAFNLLRAENIDIKLVLSGDTLQGPKNIPSPTLRKSIETSSYINDIYFLGFADDITCDWLYRNATAFVFPSAYEGFGLPVLEAMQYSSPVIAYDNEAIREVAGKYPIYTNDPISIANAVKKLLGLSQRELKKLTTEAQKHALGYTWSKTVKEILSAVTNN